MCEGNDRAKKNTLSLKTKALFLISRGCSPKEIIASLCIAKTNLAILTNEMALGGLIVKSKGTLDRREVNYTLTDAGEEYLRERMFVIEEKIKPAFPTEDAYEEAEKLIAKAVKLLDGDLSDN